MTIPQVLHSRSSTELMVKIDTNSVVDKNQLTMFDALLNNLAFYIHSIIKKHLTSQAMCEIRCLQELLNVTGEIRTRDLRFRRPLLYPAELL
ncbi:hypothetical protein LCUFL03_180036 [Latilactobacillus curvatus]|nr:hypothetical protein LCUFL03_180036 [Latilactobacillus curvatus]